MQIIPDDPEKQDLAEYLQEFFRNQPLWSLFIETLFMDAIQNNSQENTSYLGDEDEN